MNFTPSRPTHAANTNPPPSKGFNIQFSLPGGGIGATASANNATVLTKSTSSMVDSDMPAGEDAFSHMSGKTGHTTHEQDEGAHSYAITLFSLFPATKVIERAIIVGLRQKKTVSSGKNSALKQETFCGEYHVSLEMTINTVAAGRSIIF